MDDIQKFHTVRGYQVIEQNKKLLTPAMEDYLEMIYRNSLTEGYMRINMLAEMLNVQAPSATKMVQKLARLKMVHYKKYGIILLTENGEKVGKALYDRHNTIEVFLRKIGVEENLLIETELIEHNISPRTLYKIEMFNKFFDTNPDIALKYKEFMAAGDNNSKGD